MPQKELSGSIKFDEKIKENFDNFQSENNLFSNKDFYMITENLNRNIINLKKTQNNLSQINNEWDENNNEKYQTSNKNITKIQIKNYILESICDLTRIQ